MNEFLLELREFQSSAPRLAFASIHLPCFLILYVRSESEMNTFGAWFEVIPGSVYDRIASGVIG
jgi:hypothetical protein